MKKGFFQIGLVVLVASFAVAGLLINKLKFSSSLANSCGSYTDSTSCNKSCSPVKSDGVSKYKCKWLSATSHCVESANKCDAEITKFGNCSDITSAVNVYYCKGMMSAVGGGGLACSKTDPLPQGAGWDSVNKKIVGKFCGTIQVDERDGGGSTGNFCSLIDSSGCKTDSPPVITPTPTIKPTATPTIKPTASPTVKPTVAPTKSPSPTPAGVCKITFVPADHKAVCWKDARDFTVTYKVESLPSNGIYYMQTYWAVHAPSVGPDHYNESQRIYAGQTYSFTAKWPGVSGNPSNVDVQLGLNVVDANHNLISPNCSMGLDYYWTPYVCKFTPTPKPTITPTVKPTKSPSPTPTIKPTFSPTPSATPVEKSYLKICKYKDENGNGNKDSEDGGISWNFNYKYDDAIRVAGNHWWNIFDKGCVKVEVPVTKNIVVSEEGKSGWELTAIYADTNKTSGGNYIYNSESGKTKEVWFLNKLNPQSTPTVGEPNSCNGTCGSNSNCQSGLYCYQGYCRNPSNPQSTSCNNPEVLGTSAPVTVLPKTGNNMLLSLLALSTIGASGLFIYRKFKLV